MMKIQLIVFCLLANHALAEVIRIEIKTREPFANGHRFGRSGAYESIAGRLYFEVTPDAAANARITDLKRAPCNARGKVEFWADFFLMKPVDSTKGNGCLLYDVHNRGNKLALWTFNEGERTNEPLTMEHAGNGFLLKRGYTLLWTGWNGDVMADGTGRLLAGLPIARGANGKPITGRNHVEISVDEKAFSRPFFWSPWGTADAYPSVSVKNVGAKLTMRPSRNEPAIVVPRSDWAFARFEEGKAIPDATSLYVKAGFRPGWLYDLVYTARDPRVSGLGLAGLREAVSFFRYADTKTNPVRDAIRQATIFGISQSGRLIHHFMYEGLNLDVDDRMIFDGAILLVPGAGKGLFNYRFAMATVYGTYRRSNLAPSDFFPFTPFPQNDPVTGQTADSLARLRAKGKVPKMMFVQSATEYWSRAASLLHTDVEGKRDLELAPNVRIYSIAGAQHLGGGTTDKGICQHPRNPLKHRGLVLRALLVAMDRWVAEGSEPPASRYPRIDNGSLVDIPSFRKQFPAIPDVGVVRHRYAPLRLDLGPRWHTEGIATIVPPGTGPAFVTLVP
ncbi:MAG: alpha/beta hydrolase domain-containing protein, partial [Limisphaerales bacterium]